jgi:predicted  nucleic acid-binding Zn-ribbon protein
MTFQKAKTPIKCERCGYEWKYKGKLKRTTCPNCGNKTRTHNPLEILSPVNTSALTPQEDPTTKMLREYLES